MGLKIHGDFIDGNNKVVVDLSLIVFREDDISFVYSPALDLTGYGHNQEEAKRSFQEALSEFLTYTTHKKTLLGELKKLGWVIEKKRIKSPPSLVNMINKNEYLADIFEHKQYRKFNESVQLPAA